LHNDASLAEDQGWAHFEKQACPDLKLTVGPMVAEGDLVSVLWIARGTNTAQVGWLPATGAKIEERGITIWRIDDGKIREEWSSFNELRIVREVLYQLRWKLLGLFVAVSVVLWFAARRVQRLLFRGRSA
jgi:predicted ester cyclase